MAHTGEPIAGGVFQPETNHSTAPVAGSYDRRLILTPEGLLLANPAAEIVGRVDAATNELAAQVGLQTGRVRLAANASALATVVPKAAATLARAYRESN